MDTDSLSDDVFEEDGQPNPKYVFHKNDGLNINEPVPDDSPTGYPGYKPPREAVRMYAMCADYFKNKKEVTKEDVDDGWKSYKIEDDDAFDDSVVHKVCTIKPIYFI